MVRLRDQSLALLQTQRHAQRAGDGLRDVFLDGEHVGELAVVILGPEMHAVVGLDELRRDAHAVARLAHRAFDQMGRAQRLADGAHILVLALELEGRGARDHAQVRHLGERRR